MSLVQKMLRGLVFPEPKVKGRVIGLLIGMAFGAVGLLLGSLWWVPIESYLRSADWERVQARVVKSEVEVIEHSEGGSAIPRVGYTYEYEGRRLRGDRLDFGTEPTNIGGAKMRALVESYPVGGVIEVWVDPEDPEESVVQRELSYQVWVSMAGSVPFLLMGICGVAYGLVSGMVWRRGRRLREGWVKDAPERIREALDQGRVGEDEALICSEVAGKYEGMTYLAAALFWNGIVGVFVIGMVEMLQSGDGMGYFLVVFVIPFVVIGFILARMALKGLFGKEPPSWIFFARGTKLGKHGDQAGVISLEWMPIAEGQDGLRECSVRVVRWKARTSLKKWAKKNPRWRKALLRMQKGERGKAEFPMERLVGRRKLGVDEYSVNLVMSWKGRDGVMREAEFLLSKPDHD